MRSHAVPTPAGARPAPAGGLAVPLAVPCYVLLFAVAHLNAAGPFAPSPWNGAPALLVLLAALVGTRAVGPGLLAVVAGQVLARGIGTSPAACALGCGGAATAYLAAGLLVHRARRAAANDPTLADLARFLALAGGSALGAAAAWVAAQGLADGGIDAPAAGALLTRTLIGDLVGIVTTAPLLLMWVGRHGKDWRAGARAARQMARDYAAFVALLVPLLALVFGLRPFDEYRTSYLLFLPMVGIALRHGLAGAALVVPLVQGGLIASVALTRTRSASAYEYQLLMLTLAVGALCLGALATERARALQALARRDAELREREIQANQALRAAGASEMASALAHELNQPLSAIGTYARACHEMMTAPERHRERLSATLDKVARESARAGDIVRRMRDFFRSGALKLETVEVAGLVAQVREQVDDRCERSGIVLRTEIAYGLPAILADPVQMRIVLANLLNNSIDALRAAPAPREIALRARAVAAAGGTAVRIDVEDTGPGVAIEVREQLFEPLATSKPDGMGLGLAIARGIVSGHGGNLWLDATAARTTFSLQLPSHG